MIRDGALNDCKVKEQKSKGIDITSSLEGQRGEVILSIFPTS